MAEVTHLRVHNSIAYSSGLDYAFFPDIICYFLNILFNLI